jgi:tetratricopeptide (TPR) repeat protein
MKVLNLSENSEILWLLGYPDRAFRSCHEALDLATRLAHPFSQAVVLLHTGYIHHFCGDDAQALRSARRLQDLCLEMDFDFYVAHSRYMLNLAGALTAAPADARPLLDEAIHAHDVIRSIYQQELNAPLFLGWLAEACLACGVPQEAERLLTEALEIMERTGERTMLPELLRLQGVLTLSSSGETGALPAEDLRQAEESFRLALAEARRSASLSLELRAATDLARLWRRQGREADAQELLAAVVGKFTEGYETRDLAAASSLLASLAGSPAA